MMKTTIKYDKVFQKVCRILMIVTGAGLLLFGIGIATEDVLPSFLEDYLVWISLFGVASIPLFPLSMLLYIDTVVYFKRLEKNHFEIPVRKKDYEDDLGRLPRTEAVENCYAKDSKISAVLALVAFGIFMIADLLYLNRWIDRVESAFVMCCMLMFFHLIFLLLAFVLWSQRDTRKYVDDVDIRNGRKVRFNVMATIGLLILLSMVAAFSVSTADSMTRYIYKSKISSERSQW
ncbi:MAG: hypothetical protein J6N53_14365 [Lachnospiraceae bacterium]|nr:hypothetical protein [Lachnospiraceae bacterium]